jgi:hypothetical protein
MKERILIPYKPFSVNAMSFRDKRFKTTEYKEWHYKVQNHLKCEKSQEAFARMRDFFDPSKHYYSVKLTFYYPQHILFTEYGKLSANAHDCSNIEKPIIDILFLPSHFKDCNNLNIDDKYIADMHSRKRATDDYLMEVDFEILELSNILAAPE